MRVLITGSEGFVGRHFRRAYQDAGADVTCIDIAAFVAHERGDVRHFFAFNTARFDLVIHCAAVVGGRAKIEGAPLDLAVDLAIDADLFAWALRTRPGKVVYFSSSAAYPIAFQQRGRVVPLHENHIDLDDIRTPDLTYGWAKLTGEMLARHAIDAGLDVLVVRPFSGYGSDQDAAYPFPAFIDRALRREDPFDVWGDGTQVRDFIHIDDIVAAVRAAIAADVAGPVNLGTGIGVPFNTLARMVIDRTGFDYIPTLRHHPDAPQGVHYRIANATALREFYLPKIDLDTGIRRALATRSQDGIGAVRSDL